MIKNTNIRGCEHVRQCLRFKCNEQNILRRVSTQEQSPIICKGCWYSRGFPVTHPLPHNQAKNG